MTQPWSVRVTDDVKEKIENYIKEINVEGFTNNDFMEKLLNLYELDRMKNSENILSGQATEIEILLSRIQKIFIDANEYVMTILNDKEMKASEVLKEKQLELDKEKTQLMKIILERDSLSEDCEQLNGKISDLYEALSQLNKSNSTLEDLLAEYKSKNESLLESLNGYKECQNENKLLKEELSMLKIENSSYKSNEIALISNLKNLKIEMDEKEKLHKEELAELSEKNKEYMNEIESRYTRRIEVINTENDTKVINIEKELQLKLEKSILEKDVYYQLEIQKIRDTYNEKITKLQDAFSDNLEENKKKNINHKA